jgi:DNA repair exonuclease SbcCD ATPase subunit
MCSSSGESLSLLGDDASAVPPKDIFDVHQQILSQSRAIEQYISAHEPQMKSSQSFTFLKSLFGLFQSEVAMNLSLRKAMTAERRRRRRLEIDRFEALDFFKEFSCITRSQTESYDQVYDFVITRSERYAGSKNALEQTAQELQARVDGLDAAVAVRDNELQAAADEGTRRDEALKRCRRKLSAATSQIEALKVDLDESNKVIEKQRRAIRRQRQANADLEAAVKDQDASSGRERLRLQTELDEQRSRYERELDRQRLDIQSQSDARQQKLRAQLTEQRELYERELGRLRDEQANADSDWAQTELNHPTGIIRTRKDGFGHIPEKEAVLSNRESGIEEELRQRIEKLNAENVELKEAISTRDDQLVSEARKLEYTKAQHQEVVAANARLTQKNEDLEGRIAELAGVLESTRETALTKRQRLASRLLVMKAEHRENMESLGQDVESKLVAKMKTIEENGRLRDDEMGVLRNELDACRQEQERLAKKLQSKERKLKQQMKTVEELRAENERLRKLMREKADNSQLYDAAVAELRTLKELLGLQPGASAEAVIETVGHLMSRRRHR